MGTNIFDVIKSNPTYNPKNSVSWFKQNVTQFSSSVGLSPLKVLGDNLDKQSKSVLPGTMIMYSYQAKTADDLPYWDKFPLVFPFSVSKKGFHGINLHYLNPTLRAALLSKLMNNIQDDSKSKKSRLNISWSILKSASKYPEVAPCVKQYLFGYVKTNFLIVPPEDWVIAIHLPLARFTGQSESSVWKDSARMI